MILNCRSESVLSGVIGALGTVGKHLRMWVGRKEFAGIFYFLALHCVVFPAFLSMIGFSSLWCLLLTSFLIEDKQSRLV